ncbi:hypothetical protein FB472_0997 [Rhodoglobus vestalii]|uniref:Uncharacterized protein n=1 Tax=Rhodoglobus vestalii TaxID=193384 RepID=A0A8H2K686_9MICO|nr:hypothetical protein FB472_0997 [Rhodoglobus vestalii]
MGWLRNEPTFSASPPHRLLSQQSPATVRSLSREVQNRAPPENSSGFKESELIAEIDSDSSTAELDEVRLNSWSISL